MKLDILSTHTLLMAVEELTPAKSFLRDRYFPTNEATDVFATDDVLVEYKDGNKKLAPFVAPRKGGVTVLRDGYNLQRFTPPFIAPRRALTIDDINKRGFGEALYTDLTPEQRQGVYIVKDAEELGELIARREEVMAAEVMLNGGLVAKAIGDDVDNPEEFELRFYSEKSNPYVYNPETSWDDPKANILGDLAVMLKTFTSKGIPATEIVVGSDVADAIINNDSIKEFLDIRRYELGSVDPKELPEGASLIAVLNVRGRNLSVICYDETYTNDAGEDVPFIPSGSIVMCAPAAGRTTYGAVTQVDRPGGEFHTYKGKRVPKYVSSAENDSRTLTIKSRPLPIPNRKGAFVSAEVIFSTEEEDGE